MSDLTKQTNIIDDILFCFCGQNLFCRINLNNYDKLRQMQHLHIVKFSFYHTIDEIRPRRKYFWVSVRHIIAEYLEVTTIHGLRYLKECRNIVEKVFWLLIICLSFGCAAHIIQSFFVDNDREPILTTIGTSRVQEVPFPAITIRHSLHQI